MKHKVCPRQPCCTGNSCPQSQVQYKLGPERLTRLGNSNLQRLPVYNICILYCTVISKISTCTVIGKKNIQILYIKIFRKDWEVFNLHKILITVHIGASCRVTQKNETFETIVEIVIFYSFFLFHINKFIVFVS